MKLLLTTFAALALLTLAAHSQSLQTGGLAKPKPTPVPAKNLPSTAGMGETRLATNARPAGELPWAIEGHVFTLTEINEYRDALLDKIVNLKLAPVRAVQDADGKGFDVFVADAKASGERVANYAYVYFPPEGATKLNTFFKTARGELSFFVKVEAGRVIAVGRTRNIDSFTNTFAYVW